MAVLKFKPKSKSLEKSIDENMLRSEKLLRESAAIVVQAKKAVSAAKQLIQKGPKGRSFRL